jgi:hypothetical protein
MYYRDICPISDYAGSLPKPPRCANLGISGHIAAIFNILSCPLYNMCFSPYQSISANKLDIAHPSFRNIGAYFYRRARAISGQLLGVAENIAVF